MNAIVSNMSALSYLDKCHRRQSIRWNDNRPKPYAGETGTDWAHTKRQLDRFDLTRFEKPGKPMDILVPSSARIHTPKGFKFHRLGASLPENSLLDAGDGVLLTVPQLIFVQLCRGLPVMRCIKLGSFICGVYSPEPTARSGVVEREQLATQADLATFLLSAPALYGARAATQAIPWILDNAASPQETELALPFYLPSKLGGKGFIAPSMNYEVKLDPKERALADAKEFRVDVCWPEQGIGFEYNSFAEHTDEKKIAKDERRRLLLHTKGIDVELVTKEQLDDPEQVAILARLLEERGVPRA